MKSITKQGDVLRSESYADIQISLTLPRFYDVVKKERLSSAMYYAKMAIALANWFKHLFFVAQ
jgi:hypothetical protein